MNNLTKKTAQTLYANRHKIAEQNERKRLEKFISAIHIAEIKFEEDRDYLALALRLQPYWRADRENRYVLPVLRTNDQDLAMRARDAFGSLRILKDEIREFADKYWFIRILD